MISMTINQEALASLNADRHFADQFFNNPLPYNQGVNNWGVAGNTFRAFRGYNDPPSQRYHNWARHTCEEGAIENFNGIDFEGFHGELMASLTESWNAMGQPNLTPSQKFKLVDLFILRMSHYSALNQQVRAHLRNCGNPALDKFTLNGLAKMVPGLVIGSPSMGAIDSDETYFALQNVIQQITHTAGVPKLNFDVWCWPDERRKDFGILNLAG